MRFELNGRFARALTTATACSAFAVFALAACAGDNSGRGGTLVIATGGDADVLIPPIARNSQSLEVTDLLFDRLADIGPDLNTLGDAGWTPHLATRWEWARDSMTLTFHLDPRARWQDGQPVRAQDVRFAFQLYTDPKVGASGGSEITAAVDSISVGDSVTCTAWFKVRNPERFYALTLNLVPLPEHLLGKVPHDSLLESPFAHHPVGNGPFKFVQWDANQRIEIAAVENYYRGRPRPDRVIWTIIPDAKAAAQRVIAGDADFIEKITPADLAEVAKHPELAAVHIRGSAHSFVLFNMHDGAADSPHPVLGDRNVRRALTMALDRKAMVANVFDSLARVPLGPFTRLQWSADSTLHQIPFDRAAAAKLLDSIGWRAGKDGMRSRGAKPLAFSLLIPTSQVPQQFAVLLQEQFRQVGVRMDIEQIDGKAVFPRLVSHHFDATIMLIRPSPSPTGARQLWSSAAITQANGLNVGRFSSKTVDAEFDSTATATNVAAARAHYRAVYQTLVDEAPGVWLFEPVTIAAANTRITLPRFRDDAWWASIPEWRLTPAAKK